MTADQIEISARWSRWDRLCIWRHGRRFEPLEIVESDGGLLIHCSCGGFAQIWRLDDGMTKVGDVTCALWVRLKRVQRGPWLPEARTALR